MDTKDTQDDNSSYTLPFSADMSTTLSQGMRLLLVLTPGTVLYPIMRQAIAGTSLSGCGWTSASINKIYAIPAGI